MDITKIPIIQITQGTSIIEINPQSDVGVASGTLKLNRVLVNNELKFGELYSDKFEVEIYNIEDDLSGCPIQLFIEENNVRTVLFTGIIESSKRDRIGYSRKIIAYDWAYYHRDDNIASWWNSFWVTSRVSATIKEIRDSLMTNMGFVGDSNTYVNDSITIPNEFNLYTDLRFHTIIGMICELQGTLPHIAEDGSFKFISLTNTNTEDITGDYEGNNCNWEDYTTNAITGVGIYSTSDDLSQLIGTNTNVYRVSGNIFALVLDATTLGTLGTNLLSAISTIQFVPNTIKMKITNFDLTLGQRYNTEHGYGYVMSNSISGVCMVEQTLKSVAMGENLSEAVSTKNDTMIEGAKMSKFEQTIDGFQTEVSQATQAANTALNRANGSITTDTLHYLATPLSSGVTTETAGWTTTPQSMTPTNKYLWTYHTYTYADAHTSDTTPVITGVYGEDGQQGQQGPAGQDGTSVTITSQSVTYQEGTSGTTAPTGTWSTTVPTVANGNYLWTKTVVTYSDNTSTTSYSVARQGQNGQSGSSVTITSQSVDYQVSSSGTTVPSGTWSSTPQATTAGQYLWTRTIVNYSTGNSTTSYSVSAHGQNGANGQDGANGISITSVVSIYYASDSSTPPSAPSSEVTTTSTSVYNTWTKGVPALTSTYNKLYTCDQVKYSNNTFTWTTPVLNNAITTVSSEITQLASEIVLKVDNNGKVVKVALDGSGTSSQVTIKGDNIQLDGNVTITSGFVLNVGTIQSANYVANTSGMKITLSNGAFDSKNFKISTAGNVSTTNLYAKSMIFQEELLYNWNGNNYYFAKVDSTTGSFDIYDKSADKVISISPDATIIAGYEHFLYENWYSYGNFAGGASIGILGNYGGLPDAYVVKLSADSEGGQITLCGKTINWIIDSYDNASLRFLHSNGKWIRFANDGTIWYSNNARRCVGSYTNTSFTTVTDIVKITSSNYAVLATGSGNFSFSIASWSDSALKKNIKDSQVNALDIINTIKMREFDFKEKEYGTHEDIGYVANELVKIIPEAVVEVPISDEDKEKYGKDTLYQVNDGAIVKYLVKAVQELSKEVKRLKNGGNEE